MEKDDWRFLKFLAVGLVMAIVFLTAMNLSFKAIDYHFPTKFDKLIHCNKDK